MVSEVIKYSGIYAKTCALRKTLLKYEDYMGLASSGDVKGFADMLGEREAYKESIQEAVQFGANRVAIERSLLKSLYRDYAALYSFVGGRGERKYMDVIFLKYAVGIIKRLIRRLFDHRDIRNNIPKYGNFMTQHLRLNVEKIEQSSSFEELLESVRGTEFYTVLSNIDREKATLFDYEMRLDFYLFNKIHSYQEKYLDKKDKEAARRINGSEIDLQNIMWIYRAKTYYDISEEKIYTYLIPLHYMMTAETLKRLVQAEDREAFLGVLSETHYKDVFKELETDAVERSFRDYMNKLYEAERKRNPYSLASVVSHFYLKGQEIRNLTTLLECVRYGLHPDSAIKKITTGHLKDSPASN